MQHYLEMGINSETRVQQGFLEDIAQISLLAPRRCA
jgi:hypothetical protein